MTTFVTGSSGFVGLALTERLLAEAETVIGFDCSAPRDAALRAFAALPGRFVALTGDTRDTHALTDAMRTHRPSRLVTLAAITADAARERAMPQTIFEVNVGGALAALDAAAKVGVERMVHGSSGSVYGASGRQNTHQLSEDLTPLLPEALYGISKRTAEEAVLRLARLHGLSLTIGRLGTCFGPWEADSGVRDTLSAPLQVLQRARRGETVILPRAHRRDWLYVRDAAAALAGLLAHSSLPHVAYNVAAGFEWSVADWCERLAARYPGFDWRIAREGDVPNIDYYADYDRASMDITRLLNDSPFVPQYDLAAAEADFDRWINS